MREEKDAQMEIEPVISKVGTIDVLAGFTTDQLEKEVKRRKYEEKMRYEHDLKRREVAIICPICHGTGRQMNHDVMKVACGEERDMQCQMCQGTGTTIGHRAK